MEEEEESSDDSAKSLAKKQTLPSLWNRALRFGKTAVIAGAAVVTAPVVIPQAVVGFAFSVPFGVYFAGLVYTENVMRALFLSNCQYEIVENQDVQIVLQDKDTSPTSLYYLNANLEEVEIKHTSEDDINEKYYDGGTYENTNVVLRVVQENENNLTSDSDERNGDDICIFMQSSRDDKCDSELPLCSNNTECGDMILPVHLEEEALDEAGRRDLENQQASKNVNDQNSDAEIYYEEQEKLSELQQQGCGSGIEALGLNEALHKLEERSIDEGGDIIEDVHSFNVIEPIAETKEIVTRKEDESMNEGMDLSKRNYNAETYDEEKNLSDLQQHGCGLGTEALGLNEALHKLEERSIGNEDDIGKDVGHSFVIDPTAEMKDKVTIKDNESSYEEDYDERDSNVETYNEQKNKLSTLRHGCGLRIEELGLNEALRDMEVGVIAEDGTNECDNSPFIIQEPLVENEERDISNDDKSMYEDIKLNDQDLDSIALTDDPGKEECTLENEALHKMEDSVIAEKDRTNECNNPPFIVLESPVEKEEKYISNNDKSVNNAMKLNDQELDSLDLKDDPEIEECALGNDGKLKDEVDGEAIETTVLGNVSTGEAESEHGFVHVFGGDNSHSETNQSTVNELNKLGTEPPMLDEQTHENGENVIEENERRIESYAFPDQPLDGNTGTTTSYKPNDQIGDELLYNPAHFDKVTDEVEHERDDTSAEMDMEHHTMLQPNPNEEENDLEKDEIGEGCLLKLENDDAGQTDYIELKNDTIMETGKEEEEEDIEVCTEMSDEHTEETGTGAALQTAYIELTDDMNWDTSKEEEETPLLASIETEDEMNGNIENNEETDVDMERKIDELNWDASKDEEETPLLASVKLEDEMKGNIEDNEETDVNMVRKIDELNWDTSKQEEVTSLLTSIITEDEMKGNMEDNVETNVSLDRKIEHLDNMFDLTNAMDDNLILKDMDNKVKVWEETSEDQPKTSYLYAAVMPKEVESEIVDHKTEKGTVDVKQELTGDESFMAKDDNPLEELPTVPEEREISFEFPDSSSEMTMENQPKTDLLAQLNIDGSYKVKDDESVGDLPTVPEEQEINFEVPCSSSNQTLSTNLNRTGEKVEDSSEGKLDVLGDETKDVTAVETKETLAPMEYENENVESSISIDHAFDIENRSSDITSAESRVEVTLVDGSELVHFHDEVIYGEDAIWEQIEALRTIIGCKAEIHPSLTDELKGLYLLIGVEPPASLDETSDLMEVTDKLEFLKTVIGVK